ncbi:MAG TPA: GNAT family N-acetyltransferase [Lysobacter sp.]|nr:GNAT family N-acetyltransferase [Lysobacter sp.]
MSVRIRRAVPADAPTLSALGTRTFIDSFGHLYSAKDLQAFLDESHTPEAYTRYLADPAYALWLAEKQGAAIGYALAGPCGLPHDDAKPGDGELKRLYMLPSAQGDGVGARLFDEALAWLERGGPRTLWISVWSENYGAQRFYARYGFEKAGEYEFIVGQQRDHEFMYRRAARTA